MIVCYRGTMWGCVKKSGNKATFHLKLDFIIMGIHAHSNLYTFSIEIIINQYIYFKMYSYNNCRKHIALQIDR